MIVVPGELEVWLPNWRFDHRIKRTLGPLRRP